MSKDTFVKAATQGGDTGSGGGGPAGTWNKVSSGQQAITAGATVTLIGSIAQPPGSILVAFISILGGGGSNHVCPGSTAAAPNTSTIVWDLSVNGANFDLKARAGVATAPDTVIWVVYEFTPS
jgi:hypothetical protein